MYNWVICVHSPHVHSINYILLHFFVAVGNKNLGRQELNQLAAQFEDEHMECHIRICARLDAERCIKGDIVHSFKIDICTATV